MAAKDFSNYDIEDFVNYILDRKIKEKDFKELLNEYCVDDILKKQQLQKLEFAYARISKGLNIQEIFSFIIVPFGIANRLYENKLFDVENERKQGYIRRVNQYLMFSVIGILFYLLLLFFLDKII